MHEILEISADEYRARPGVNASLLEILFNESPRHLKATLDGQRKEESDAMRFGTLFHQRILEPHAMDYYVHPETFTDEKTGKEVSWHWGRKPCKEWKAAHADKPIVSPADVQHLEGMADSLRNYPEFMEHFRGGKSEQSLFAADKQGTLRKARIDRLKLTGNVVMDLKSCASCHPDEFQRAISKRGYHRRAAFYIDLCRLCGLDKHHFFLVAVETRPPYVAQIYKLSANAIECGRQQYRKCLQEWRNHTTANHFPSYGGGIIEMELPEWELEDTADLI